MAAITITCPPGTYEATMREARGKIDLEGIGIKGVKIRRAITGALVYEIPGEKSHEMADTLALRLKQTLSVKERVRVQRPMKMAELRLRGLDVSSSPSEVREAVATHGNCEEEEITAGDIKRSPNGMGVIWVRCPLTAANQLSVKGQIKIGWALVRVELLENRPLQCFKCLEGGHVRARCPNNTDRSGKCYRCGQDGHVARDCSGPVLCTVCQDRGLPSNHRTGSKACTPVQKGRRGIPFDTMKDSRKQITIAITAPVKGDPGGRRCSSGYWENPEGAAHPPNTGQAPRREGGGTHRWRCKETTSQKRVKENADGRNGYRIRRR